MADDQDQQADDLLDRVRQRRDDSLQWFDDNYYKEFIEVNKMSKCRTEPIIVKGRDGKTKEDLTRTNVAYPDAHVMIRRNTARMTAQPPTNRYLVPNDPNLFGENGMFAQTSPEDIAEGLSAWNLMQFNLSGEIREHRLHVQQEETFGWSVMEHLWKTLSVERVFRYQLTDKLPRELLMKSTGSFSDEEIKKEIELKGQRVGPDDLPELKARYGSEIVHRTRIPRFNGPTGRMCFIGDVFPEPGFRLLDESPYVIKQSFPEKDWLDDIADETYFHPETNAELPVFDEAQVKLLLADGTEDAKQQPRGTRKELRSQLWDSIGKDDPDSRRVNSPLPGKRFHILAEHTKDEDGRWQVLYVANEKFVLNSIDPETGKRRPMPYPFDLFGMSMFTEMVGLPDIISGIGDSTPRLLRFLIKLRHTVVNQRTDLVNNILRRAVLRKNRADLPDQPVERSQMRIYDVKDPSDFFFPQEADVPPGAFETEHSVVSAMQAAEPSLSAMETGSNQNPGSGKTATAATITQRNIEGMMAYKLDGLHLYNGAVAMKKLAMLQQMAEEPIKIPSRFIKSEGLMKKLGANTTYELDPYALQTDIEVLPEEGSTLPVDDEFRRMSAENVYRLAAEDPVIWNKREVAKVLAGTIRGIDANKVINPAPDPNAPPPPPEMKVNISVTMKFEDLQPETQAAVLSRAGLPFNVEEGHAKEALKAAGEVGAAATSVGALAEGAGDGGQGAGSGTSASAG